MRFFTPELYLQFNSSDDEVADRADEAWGRAVQEYRQHLDGIRSQMPSQVREVAELCLHDAEVLGLEEVPQAFLPYPEPFWPGPLWTTVALMTLQREEKLTVLVYMLWDRVRQHPGLEDWPFTKTRKHWLYDEMDVASEHRPAFLHRILFSDGSVVEVPFVSVIMSSVPVPALQARTSRRSA